MATRIFYTMAWLTPKDQEKVRQDRKLGTDGPVEIKYRKKRCVEDVELNGLSINDWMFGKTHLMHGFNDPVFSRYVTVFGACEAKDGECCRKLEDAWNAEQMELIP